MTAPIVTEASRRQISWFSTDSIIFDADNAPRFRHLRRIDGLLWARVAEASSPYAFKEERNA